MRLPHASSVSLNPSPEVWEFLGAQPEKRDLEAKGGQQSQTTEEPQKRKADSSIDKGDPKVRK